MDLHAVATAGSRSVLLAFSPPAPTDGCVGFAISRRCPEGKLTWHNQWGMSGGGEDDLADLLAPLSLGDEQRVGPLTRATADEARAREQAVRAFRWGDYTVLPGETYTYTVHAVLEAPDGSRRLEGGTTLTVRTEPTCGHADGSEVHFNRGVAGSQAYAQRFGSTKPRDQRPAGAASPWAWLSNGLEEALLRFLGRAEGAGWAIRGACYEFTYAPVLRALGAARDRGVDVCVIYDSKPASWHAERREWTEHGPSALNDAAVRAAGIDDLAVRRANAASAIAHNKFFLLLRRGEPQAVWTGSTNITTSGLFGHLNVGHVCALPPILSRYAAYWERLRTDPPVRDFGPFNSADSPLPPPGGEGGAVIFSPRDSDAALRYYAALLRGARQAVFLTAAFGLSAPIAEGLLHYPDGALDRCSSELPPLPPHDVPTYLLLDNEGRQQSARFVQAVRRLPQGHVACGSHLPLDGLLPGHEAEALTELNKHVDYVHTKFLLVDPLGDAPVVVSGSANFSAASTRTNDENMLVLRGADARRVARLYLVEFMRVHTHFAARDAQLARIARESGVDLFSLRHPRALSDDDARRAREAALRLEASRGRGVAADGERWMRDAFVEGKRRQVERLLFLGRLPERAGSGDGAVTRDGEAPGGVAAAAAAVAVAAAATEEEPVGGAVEAVAAPAAAADADAAAVVGLEAAPDSAPDAEPSARRDAKAALAVERKEARDARILKLAPKIQAAIGVESYAAWCAALEARGAPPPTNDDTIRAFVAETKTAPSVKATIAAIAAYDAAFSEAVAR